MICHQINGYVALCVRNRVASHKLAQNNHMVKLSKSENPRDLASSVYQMGTRSSDQRLALASCRIIPVVRPAGRNGRVRVHCSASRTAAKGMKSNMPSLWLGELQCGITLIILQLIVIL